MEVAFSPFFSITVKNLIKLLYHRQFIALSAQFVRSNLNIVTRYPILSLGRILSISNLFNFLVTVLQYMEILIES